MQFRAIKPAIRHRVTEYMQDAYPERRLFDEKQLLDELPPNLYLDALADIHQVAPRPNVCPIIPPNVLCADYR